MEVPSTTFPKLTLEGVTEMPGCAPVPVKGIVVGVSERLVVTAMLPETLAVDVGVNVALKVMLLPEARVCAENPVTPNAVPVRLSDEIVRLAVPVFFSVIAWVAVVPSATVPKLTFEGATEMPACDPVPLRAMVSVGLEASLETTRLPLVVAADEGAN